MKIFQMKRKRIIPKFVDFVPDTLEEGVLYISIMYDTMTHKCACGCGKTVVTPITPTDWSLTWNGKTVTLKPSIGNWDLPCQSHYLIIENKIIWAGKWSTSKIKTGREIDRLLKDRYYGELQEQQDLTSDQDS